MVWSQRRSGPLGATEFRSGGICWQTEQVQRPTRETGGESPSPRTHPHNAHLSTFLGGWLHSPHFGVGRLRFTQVKPFVHRASEGRSHSLDPGMPRSKALFHTTHEARTWGQMGYTDHICQTKNVSTQNDKYTCGCEDSAMERWNVG